MSDVLLRFSRLLNTTHPVDLVFNDDDGTVVKDNVVSLSAEVAAPRFSSKLLHARTVTSSASVSAPVLNAQLDYDNSVFRGITGKVTHQWEPAQRLIYEARDEYQQSDKLGLLIESKITSAYRLDMQTSILNFYADSVGNDRTSGWQEGLAVSTQVFDYFSQMIPIACGGESAWQLGKPLTNESSSYYQQMSIEARTSSTSWWDESYGLCSTHTDYSGAGRRYPFSINTRWQLGRKTPPGKSSHVVIEPIHEPCYTPPLGSQVYLVFNEAFSLSTDLIFTCLKNVVPTTKIIPIQRTYIVINEVELRRVDGNHLLPDVTLSMNIDMDSWTWAFNASMPASALPLVEPSVLGEPVLLEANINGAHYLLLAEAIQRDRQFAKATITVSGRGQSAMLAEPYSPMLNFNNTIERTAQQLMNDALMMNGVSIGWSVDWRIEDWLVPVNTWNHQGSYMSAVTAIANAAGAFIQPDPVAKILRVRPRVPVKPWEMIGAVPDIILPSAAVTKEAIEWSDKPSYNVVYVSGTTSSGVLGCVKRSGSSGDAAAPMVTHALITNAIAARQRGIVSLANTGRMAKYSLSLPVFDNVGIVEVGSIIDYEDGNSIKGVVQSASVVGSLGKVRQTIEVLVNG